MRRGIVFVALFGALTMAPAGAMAAPWPKPSRTAVQAPPGAQDTATPGVTEAPPDVAVTEQPTEVPTEAPAVDPTAPAQDPTQDPAEVPTENPATDPAAEPTQAVTEPPAQAVAPIPADLFIDIRRVRPNRNEPRTARGGSAGSFVSQCGTNGNAHHNPDNFIVAPGVSNGAHHTHDYVGNLSTDGFSTDQSLQAAGTTCRNDDRSTYFWPVLRVRNGAGDVGEDGNVGTILRPASANLRFRGNPRAKVVAMPRFLRVITGNAKSVSQAGANAAAQWTCTGFQNRITQKYPICPQGSRVTRILDFPSCWDGQNVDSANHRTHVVFPDKATGACPAGTKAIPQLRMTLTYNVSRAKARSIALDSFPEEQHDPITDHADFEQVMPQRLTQRIVTCVNTNRNC
ncbi:DUF1996 domain-containing protein [Actinocorallia longicatena]|uniref:DUF1996 domain-containing protein n=1 Tax=Actinocorallia longicatena TaxID=111803 RepID=A0ABP6QJQ1_9ACTN